MASIIKANKLQDFAGNDILSSDGAGVITPNANGIKNVPAFLASLSSSQSLSHNTYTKIVCDSESFDTDTAYDTSTGRFTVPSGEAGKYYFCFEGYTYDSSYKQIQSNPTFYKNGSKFVETYFELQSDQTVYDTYWSLSHLFNLSVGDYIEPYYRHKTSDSGALNVEGSSSSRLTYFYAYKLIGA